MSDPLHRVWQGDAGKIDLPDDSVDLIITSPPYEDARAYGELDVRLKGQDWVDWAVACYREQLRVCRGLVAWVVAGRTRSYRWSATPALLMADLHRAGVKLRNPPVALYHRIGIPGSGGPDWWRNDYEWIICATREGGRLPWSDNVATGHPPKCPPGGAPSHQSRDGRVNRPRLHAKGGSSRGAKTIRQYKPPRRANPGNVISLGAVGGGSMGSTLSIRNEAPFPEQLVEPFVLSYCPPGGIVYDPFCGSGTSLAVAIKHGRVGWGSDLRPDQVELSQQRIVEAQARREEAA